MRCYSLTRRGQLVGGIPLDEYGHVSMLTEQGLHVLTLPAGSRVLDDRLYESPSDRPGIVLFVADQSATGGTWRLGLPWGADEWIAAIAAERAGTDPPPRRAVPDDWIIAAGRRPDYGGPGPEYLLWLPPGTAIECECLGGSLYGRPRYVLVEVGGAGGVMASDPRVSAAVIRLARR
jgi:hypothetical protein